MSRVPAVPVTPAVIVRDGVIRASSRDIAMVFAKRHDRVLRAADDLISKRPELLPNFGVTIADIAGPNGAVRRERMMEMDRRAFTLLVMGFTGETALDWKIAYADEFDRMESALAAGRGGPVVVQDFSAEARSIIGGISRSVQRRDTREAGEAIVRSAVQEIIGEVLPGMVAAAVASTRFEMVEGMDATDVIEAAGYQRGRRPRGLTQYVSAQLVRAHEARAVPVRRSRRGRGGVKLFDETTARAWLRSGGKAAIDRYVKEKKGQGRLL